MSEAACTHIVICRAADADPEGPNAQAKISLTKPPDSEVLESFRAGIIDLYRRTVGRDPERVGVAVLPWVGELDGDEEGAPDE